MSSLLRVPIPKRRLIAVIASAVLIAAAVPTNQALVTRIVIDATAPIAGQPYQQLTGRAFGELDPDDPHNALITDIALGPENRSGKVEHIAGFLRIPSDLTQASGVMWHGRAESRR